MNSVAQSYTSLLNCIVRILFKASILKRFKQKWFWSLVRIEWSIDLHPIFWLDLLWAINQVQLLTTNTFFQLEAIFGGENFLLHPALECASKQTSLEPNALFLPKHIRSTHLTNNTFWPGTNEEKKGRIFFLEASFDTLLTAGLSVRAESFRCFNFGHFLLQFFCDPTTLKN